MTAPARKPRGKRDPLVGKFFHRPVGASYHQGEIIARAGDGLYLVQLYDWFVGAPSNQEVVPAAAMVGWALYESADEWRRAGDAISYDSRRRREVVPAHREKA